MGKKDKKWRPVDDESKNFIDNEIVIHSFDLCVEFPQVLDVPGIRHFSTILSFQSIGTWSSDLGHDKRAFPWCRQLVGTLLGLYSP